MKPSIKPPPPINRQRRPRKKYKREPQDWSEIVGQPWFKPMALIFLGFVCLSLLIKFWPSRDAVTPTEETIANVESKAHSATRVEPVKLGNNESTSSEPISPDPVEAKRERVLGFSSERLTGQFVSVVASMESIDTAIEMHQDLRKSEINSEIITDYSKDKLWYRVVASRSTEKSKVERASRRFDFDTWITSLSSRAKLVISYD